MRTNVREFFGRVFPERLSQPNVDVAFFVTSINLSFHFNSFGNSNNHTSRSVGPIRDPGEDFIQR